MATLLRSSSSPILLIAAILLLSLGFLSSPISAARPCKTLFITFTVEPIHLNHRPNPNLIFSNLPRIPINNDAVDRQFVSDSVWIVDRRPNFISFDHREFLHPKIVEQQPQKQTPSFLGLFPLPTEGIDFDSLFDRTKDVMSVVVALLFGVGCGALTAATMYFAWTLFAGRGDYDEETEGFCYSEYDDIPSPKKGGYVKIPEAVQVAVKEVA